MSKHLDRREFMSVAAATAAVALVPVPSLVAAGPVTHAVTGPVLADWTIDDMFGVYPRYSEAIGYGHPHEEHIVATDPLDALLRA